MAHQVAAHFLHHAANGPTGTFFAAGKRPLLVTHAEQPNKGGMTGGWRGKELRGSPGAGKLHAFHAALNGVTQWLRHALHLFVANKNWHGQHVGWGHLWRLGGNRNTD